MKATGSFLDNFETIASSPGGVNHLRRLILGLATRGDLSESKDGWVEERLSEIATYGRRSQLGAEQLSPDAWILDLEDIEKNSSSLLRRVTLKERPTSSSKSAFFEGDVLYGKLRPYLDKVLIAREDGYCTTEIVPIVPSGSVTSEWLRICLKSPKFLDYVASKTYGVKMPRLGTKDALASIHPVPPLAEQERIVAKVDELMELCDELEDRQTVSATIGSNASESALRSLSECTTPEELQDAWGRVSANWDRIVSVRSSKALIKSTILVLAMKGWLNGLQSGDAEVWPMATLSDIAEVRLGRQRSPSRATGPRMRSYLRAANVTWDGLNFNDVKQMDFTEAESEIYQLREGDILLSEASGSPGEVGKPAQFRSEVEACCFQNTLIRVRLNEGFSPDFYEIFFRQQAMSGHFAEGSRGQGINHLGAKTLARWLVPVPSVEQQARVVARVGELMQFCKDLEQAHSQARLAQQCFAARAALLET